MIFNTNTKRKKKKKSINLRMLFEVRRAGLTFSRAPRLKEMGCSQLYGTCEFEKRQKTSISPLKGGRN